MNKAEALEMMKQGHKIIHKYFTPDEYLHIVNGVITSEEGYNFTMWWRDTVDWKQDGYSIRND